MMARNFHCFYRQQLPVPGTHAQVVTYPACEWRVAGETGDVSMHPLNRFVCSWLSSDLSEVSRCDEVLHAMTQIEAGDGQEWFADGDAFTVDICSACIQFNPSNVGSDDTAYWNQPQGRFTFEEVRSLLRVWRDFLAAAEKPATL